MLYLKIGHQTSMPPSRWHPPTGKTSLQFIGLSDSAVLPADHLTHYDYSGMWGHPSILYLRIVPGTSPEYARTSYVSTGPVA